jgi:hypothetical protein
MRAGRNNPCTVRLADDEHLTRRAFALKVRAGYVVIHNTSTTKPLVVRPPIGEDHVVAPGSATTSLPHRTFGIVLAGSRGDVAVHVDAQATNSSARAARAARESLGRPATRVPCASGVAGYQDAEPAAPDRRPTARVSTPPPVMGRCRGGPRWAAGDSNPEPMDYRHRGLGRGRCAGQLMFLGRVRQHRPARLLYFTAVRLR